MSCQHMAVPMEVMHHVVRVESSYNRYAIGVVGGHLVRQPKNLPEALATVRMLESGGYNFSLGLAQVNRYNLDRYGIDSYEKAFEICPNLQAGSRILAECYRRSGGNWGKSFSCYYSGDFATGYRHGYVQKVYASIRNAGTRRTGDASDRLAIRVVDSSPSPKAAAASRPESAIGRLGQGTPATAGAPWRPSELTSRLAAAEQAPHAQSLPPQPQEQTAAPPPSTQKHAPVVLQPYTAAAAQLRMSQQYPPTLADVGPQSAQVAQIQSSGAPVGDASRPAVDDAFVF